MVFILQQLTVKSFVLDKVNEGGPFIMIPLLLIFAVCLLLSVRSFIQVKKGKEYSDKSIKLLNSLGLFALVYGIFGQLLGLVEVLDQFSSDIEASVNQLAMGLKFTILSTVLGCFIFLVNKGVSVVLTSLQPNK
ncbi:MotA/TolQ/ExbB proton channel family protein [Roseivirga sp.]|uniref:MotA/TolQ/ExbB proton channel family protein n=1 Tax=Roseivirga sp. TaxID=1964215 RepID=UPI003B8D99F5